MKIDLHIHSKDGSDGKMTLEEIFREARDRQIGFMSITDHDSIDGQERAEELAGRRHIEYLSGLELNVTFSHPGFKEGKSVSLDFLGYQFDIRNRALKEKLAELRAYRKKRAERILEKVNVELDKEERERLTHEDMEAIEETVDGAFGRPHIANYLVKKGLAANRQDAFDKYLVRCNVPKMPLSLEEASGLVRGAGGKLMLAHGNDPNGTSLVKLTTAIREQLRIIRETMLPHIDGIEVWHSRHDDRTVASYLQFGKEERLMMTGGSDCHQQPVIMGTLDIPDFVAEQFR